MKTWDISFLNEAWLLAKSDFVQLEDVPLILRKDIETFLFGKTVGKNEKGIIIYKEDYRAWLLKLNTKGFDYDIQLKEKLT